MRKLKSVQQRWYSFSLNKDLAANNKGARVLSVCCEIMLMTFRSLNNANLDNVISQTLLADGAGAVIVGSDFDLTNEVSLFEIVSASQTILPDSEGTIRGQLSVSCLKLHLLRMMPNLLYKNIDTVLENAFLPYGIIDWNFIFWIVHPSGLVILDQVEIKLILKEKNMRASRHVLMSEGLDCGILFGFGLPILTVEMLVLHSFLTTIPSTIATKI
nr:chalcone synthase [Tanacetum cinerariifolium]